jgi:hypothetical protein
MQQFTPYSSGEHRSSVIQSRRIGLSKIEKATELFIQTFGRVTVNRVQSYNGEKSTTNAGLFAFSSHRTVPSDVYMHEESAMIP